MLVERRAGRVLAMPVGVLLAGPARLGQRVRPCALELQDLRAMHQARRGEDHHLALLLAPAAERGRPLASAAERVDPLAAVDHAAVDQTGHHRRQLAGRDRDHRLVEQREPLLDPAHLEERPPLHVPRGGDQVTIAETSAEAGRLAGDRASALPLARLEMLLRDGEQQIALLRGLCSFLVEQPLTPREPSGRGAGLAAQEEAEADPECAAGGAPAVARVPVRPVRALQRALELLLASDQERRGRQPLEVRRAQGVLAIGQRQELVGVFPRAAVVRSPAAIQVSLAAWHQHELKRPEVKRRRQFNPEAPPAVAGTRRPHTRPGRTRSTG